MTSTLNLEFAAKTDTGLVRSHNEDAIIFNPQYSYAILADGMGGYNAGEVASSLASSVLSELLECRLAELQQQLQPLNALPPPDQQIQTLLLQAIKCANTTVYETAQNEAQFNSMGTTLVVALFQQEKVTVAHAGDSCAYRFRNGELMQLTHDHSVLQEQIDAGLITPDLARFSPDKNLITRAIGILPEIEVELHDYPHQSGDIYLLCSDGLSDMLTTEEMASLLRRYSSALKVACDALVQHANENGGTDNISVILIRVGAHQANRPNLLQRMFDWIR